MKTETLIETLSADVLPERRAEAVLPWVLSVTTLVFGGAYLWVAGVRPDLAAALSHANVLIKQVVPALLAAGGLGLVLRMGCPGAGVGRWPWLLIAGAGAVMGAMAVQLAVLPASVWAEAFRGESRATCLTVIPLMSLPILGGSLAVLRRAAPVRPGLCGAVAGLMSAGAAASAYAFFCTDDNPLFYGTWYGVGILGVTLLGYLLGRRFLRW